MLFGIHDFINSQPLLDPLMKKALKLEIRKGSPAQLADLLSDGRLDVAMIPTIEYLKQANRFRLLPNIAIASRNKVGTVLLISKLPLDSIRSLALDNRSRTSVALLQLLYSKVFPAGIQLENLEPDPEKMLENHDAALIIGDGDCILTRITGHQPAERQSVFRGPLDRLAVLEPLIGDRTLASRHDLEHRRRAFHFLL